MGSILKFIFTENFHENKKKERESTAKVKPTERKFHFFTENFYAQNYASILTGRKMKENTIPYAILS